MTVRLRPWIDPAMTYLLSGVMNVLCTPPAVLMLRTRRVEVVSITSTAPGDEMMAA